MMATKITCDFCNKVKPEQTKPDYSLPVNERWAKLKIHLQYLPGVQREKDICPSCALKTFPDTNSMPDTIDDLVYKMIEEAMEN